MLKAADLVLRQTEFYNGHGQMEISHMTLEDAIQLTRDITEGYEGDDNLFSLKVYPESCEGLSGAIYQDTSEGKDKLWLSVENLESKKRIVIGHQHTDSIHKGDSYVVSREVDMDYNQSGVECDKSTESPATRWSLFYTSLKPSYYHTKIIQYYDKPSVLEITRDAGINFDEAYDLLQSRKIKYRLGFFTLEEVKVDE